MLNLFAVGGGGVDRFFEGIEQLEAKAEDLANIIGVIEAGGVELALLGFG